MQCILAIKAVSGSGVIYPLNIQMNDFRKKKERQPMSGEKIG